MIRFDVLNRFTGAVQFTAEIEVAESATPSIKLGLAVKWAFEKNANLAGAYLAGANLAGAYLDGAYLAGANLDGANLAGANLAGAILARAYLAGANLAGAYLAGAILDGANLDGAKISAPDGTEITVTRAPLQMQGLTWSVLIWDAHMKIGCEWHAMADWWTFDDRRIAEMNGRNALKLWRAHKAAIFAMAASDGRWVEPKSVAVKKPRAKKAAAA